MASTIWFWVWMPVTVFFILLGVFWAIRCLWEAAIEVRADWAGVPRTPFDPHHPWFSRAQRGWQRLNGRSRWT